MSEPAAIRRVRERARWRAKGLRFKLHRKWSDFRARHARTASNVTRRNTRRAYDRLYRSDDLLREYLAPERMSFYKEVALRAPVDGVATVLDVGCGSGHLVRELAARLPGAAFTGLDHAPGAIARARTVFPEADWLVADVADAPSLLRGERFDLVVCTEVLEHVLCPEAMLHVMRNLCSADGVVLVTVPDGELDTFEGHVNFWSEEEFRRLLEAFGSAKVERMADGRTLVGELRPP